MTIDGGRGAFESRDFEHIALSAQLIGDVFAHGVPHSIVVGTHESSVVRTVGLAVEKYHLDAFLEGAVDGWRNGRNLVGRHDEQIDSHADEAVDLGDLPLVVVVGRNDAQRHVVVAVVGGFNLGDEFVAPDVATALRHTDEIFLIVPRARHQQHEDKGANHAKPKPFVPYIFVSIF